MRNNHINRERIAKCGCMRMDDDGVIYCGKATKYGSKEKRRCDLNLIGFNRDNELLSVCGWDWTIVKIDNGNFEYVGKTEYCLADLNENPSLLLDDAKPMTLKEIEEKLGYKIIIKESFKNK
jgi:hypothetical protein